MCARRCGTDKELYYTLMARKLFTGQNHCLPTKAASLESIILYYKDKQLVRILFAATQKVSTRKQLNTYYLFSQRDPLCLFIPDHFMPLKEAMSPFQLVT